jgi:hypothetical protein
MRRLGLNSAAARFHAYPKMPPCLTRLSHESIAVIKHGVIRFRRGAMLGWFQALMPKEERFFDLFDVGTGDMTPRKPWA